MKLSVDEAWEMWGRSQSPYRDQARELLDRANKAGWKMFTHNASAILLEYLEAPAPVVPDECVVCGRVCGSLNGNTKSWKCAGRLAAMREKLAEVSDRYAGEGKGRSRSLVVELARRRRPQSVLDLFGGGTSAKKFRRLLPISRVVSCERDKKLWPLLRTHARLNDYEAVCGDVTSAPGMFDFIWLDFCGQWSASLEMTLATVARTKLNQGGSLVVTVLPARETEPFLARSRTISLPAWLVVTTRLRLAYIERYLRSNGQDMWLCVLGWHGAQHLDVVAVHDALFAGTQWVAEEFRADLTSIQDAITGAARRSELAAA